MSTRINEPSYIAASATPLTSTLVDLLRYRAVVQPDQTAYTFLLDGELEGVSLSYVELDRRARAIAASLKAAGITSGQRALLLYPPGLEFTAGFFGCLYAGVVAIPAYPPDPARLNRTLPRLQAIVADAKAVVALTTSPLLALASKLFAQAGDLKALRWLASDALLEGIEREWQPVELTSDTLAFLQYTSGSTGAPRGVMLKHSHLLHNASLVHHGFQHTLTDKYFSWLPTFHDMGLMVGVLQPLYAGIPAVLMSPVAFLQRPILWLQGISRHRATTSGGPNFAYDLCVRKTTAEERAALDLSCWRVAFNGAEPVRAETLERFAKIFAPSGFRRESLYPCYGLAEATLIVSGGDPNSSPVVQTFDANALGNKSAIEVAASEDGARTLVGCGRELKDQHVLIVDPETLIECAPGQLGEIWVAGPSIASGYWGRPAETVQTFGACLLDTGQGPFLRTGDTAFMRDGELFIAGRLKDLIIIRGLNHYPQDIEVTVETAHPALRLGCCAAFSVEIDGEERLAVVQEIDTRQEHDFDSVIAAIREAVSKEHDLRISAVTLLKPGAIPKTSSGKIQRHASRDGFLKGTFEPLAQWQAVAGTADNNGAAAVPETTPLNVQAIQTLLISQVEVIQTWLVSQLAAKLGINPGDIDAHQPIVRYGLDSLMAIELMHGIETSLRVRLSMTNFLEGASIADIAAESIKQVTAVATAPSFPSPALQFAGEHPLSHGQKGLWFIHQLAPENTAYNIVRAVRISAELDSKVLRRAFQTLIYRHPCLRTTFKTSDGEPLQQIQEHAEAILIEEDASNWSDELLNERLAVEAQRPFDLKRCPLLRVGLFKRSEREHVMLLSIHHIVADLWSLTVLLQELGALYEAEKAGTHAQLPALMSQYVDYVRWQTELLAGAEGGKLQVYWLNQLAGELPVLNLPTDWQRPPVQSFRGGSYPFRLDAQLTRKLKALSKEQSVTLYMTLLAAFQSLLYRYTNQEDILVGCPIVGRRKAEWGRLVGYFVNPLVLRARLSDTTTFRALLEQVRDSVLQAFDHQDYPFSLLVERLQPERDPSRSPLFQAMIVLQKAQLLNDEGLSLFALGEAGAHLSLGELELESVPLDLRVSQFDLTVMLAEVGEELGATIEFSTDLFERETIERMAGHFRQLLESVVAEPGQRVDEIEMLTREERLQLLYEWNETKREFGVEKCLHEEFERQVEERAEAIAVVYEGEALSYGELNLKANQLAHRLRAEGVEPDVLVGIMMERSIEMVTGLLGILKAGGAYVPLDPEYPQERVSFMLEDAQVPVLLTQTRLLGQLPEYAGRVICLDGDETLSREETSNPVDTVCPESLAYMIYTSGSTGRPKGTMNTHRAIVNRLRWMQEAYQLSAADRVLQKTPFSFDVSVWEFFWPLLTGACLVMARPGGHRDSLYLSRLIVERQITTVHFVPSMLQVFLDEPELADMGCLKRVICSGEALSWELQDRFFARLGAELHNLYGPTEAAVDVTFWACESAGARRSVPIGRPIANTQIFILDRRTQPVPVGVAGELYIGGVGLARGYRNRPELTAEKFIPDSFSAEPGARLYRTGDLARYRAGSEIEYLGRLDHQVKIRGFRIELGEIETVVGRHHDVEQCAVVVRDDEGAPQRIVAYYVLRSEATLAVNELRAYLKAKLPEYMIPSAFVRLDALPLTPNGKVDRRAMPTPALLRTALDDSFAAPRTPVEEALSAIWAEVLGTEHVHIHDDFFDLGGHSLLATQVISRVRKVFAVELALRVLFEGPTVGELAERVEEALREGQPVEATPLVRLERDAPLRLSFAQQRLWFLDQLEPGSAFYNIPAAVHIRGSLDVEALRESVNEVVARHEALRTTFGGGGREAVQLIAPSLRLDIPLTDLRGLEATARDAEIQRLARAEARRAFDLATGPLLRVTLLQESEAEHVMLLVMHHIVSDGWSVGIFVKELALLYEAYAAGQPSPLSELTVQYADYAGWQRQWLQDEVLESQLAYWKGQLAGAPAVLELAGDRPRPAVQTFRGAQHALQLSPVLSKSIKALGRRENTTLFMTLLAAFKVLLCHYTHQEDIVIGSDIANRNRVENEGLIGFLSNMLVLRTDLSGDPTFTELLKRVHEVTLDGYAHQDLSFEKLVEVMQPKRELSYAPLFQHVFTLQNAPPERMRLSGLTLDWYPLDSGTAKFDLVFNLWDSEQGITGLVNYNTDLFDQASITRLLGHFEALLEGITEHPQRRLSELSPLSEESRYELLVGWNRTEAYYPSRKCINELFEAQVEQTPQAIAIKFEGETLTYQELNRRANRLARQLQQLGVGPGVRVGVFMQHSLEEIVGLLAIIKAGGAYVPLEPAHPAARVAFTISDARLALILTQERMASKLPASDAGLMSIDAGEQPNEPFSDANLALTATPDELVYVIYTSGSTGQPKGVGITHRALVNYVWWAKDAYLQGESFGFALYSSLAFDLTVTSIYVPLITGNKIVIYRWEGKEAPLDKILRDDQTGVLKLTPSHLALVKEWNNRQTSVKRLIVGGEALGTELARQVYESFGGQVEILNEYGPTEATVGCMLYQFEPLQDTGASVPIGRPAANVQIYVLDKWLQPTAENVTGELYIAGDGLAQGYLNGAELTAERFIANPFASGQRMYRSGDLCRRQPGGALEYLGRQDQQVKFHGYRVELQEIQWALKKHAQIRDSVVVVTKDKHGHDVLVAYYVSRQELEVAQLRAFLSTVLIEETIPNVFVHLRKFPLTLNGKVNHEALPSLAEAKQKLQRTYTPARTLQEEILAGIWAEVLGVERIGIYDNFFELGGHSLLATQVISRVRQALKVELPLRMVFESQTIAALSEKVAEAANAGHDASLSRIEPAARDQDLPLSFAQQRLWFLDQLEPNSPFYNLTGALRLSGSLNLKALRESINEVVARHEALRTTFGGGGREAVQLIAPSLRLDIPLTDLRGLEATARDAEIQRLARAEARRAFDLATGPLLRVTLLQESEAEHVMLLVMHHIVSDGWSVGIFVKELALLYEAYAAGQPSPLSELTVQYADYAGWQRQWLRGAALEEQLSYWKEQLGGAPPVLALPTDRPRPAVQTFRGAQLSLELSAELTTSLKELSQREGTTLFMTLLAAFQTLLARYSGERDLSVGVPVAGRNRLETEGLIGFFVNTLVMRTRIGDEPTFRELLGTVREVALGAYAHQDVPFEKLVEELQPERSLSHTPLFQVMFALQNAPLGELELKGLELRGAEVETETAKFDLTLTMQERGERIVGGIRYSTDLFERETMERMAGHFRQILESVVAQPGQRISTLELLTRTEQQQVLYAWNETKREFAVGRCQHEEFERQVVERAEAVAVVDEAEALTYGELNRRANQLAHHLRVLGVGAEVLVGVCMERSVEMMVALLGVMKAGGAYVPLDPQQPRERIAHMLEDARVRAVITQQTLLSLVAETSAETVVCVDRDAAEIAQRSEEVVESGVCPQNLAYVLYTSGSTGAPKGVCVEHRQILNYVNSMIEGLGLSAEMSFATVSTLAADLGYTSVYTSLSVGGRLHLISQERASDGDALADYFRGHPVDCLKIVPSHLAALLSCSEPAQVLPRRRLVLGGEACSWELIEKLRRLAPDCTVINHYGPTETTVGVLTHRIGQERDDYPSTMPPLGRPICNAQVYLLDAQFQPVPIKVSGELHIGGAGLSRGYLNSPELTAQRFIPNPFSDEPGARLYRTGDMGRYLADGNIEFLGRADNQVKVRGFRVELGEIETVLGRHREVEQCAVVVREDDGAAQSIAAYFVLTPEAAVGVSELRAYLKDKLPAYMIPSAFVQLDALPLTSNGKVDRQALPPPEHLRTALVDSFAAPRTPVEEALSAIWAEALGTEHVYIHDNFFDLGGHSLLATQVISRVRRVFAVELALRVLFEEPTVAGLAAVIQGAMLEAEQLRVPPVRRAGRDAALPLSYAQQRLWFIHQLDASNAAYNVPCSFQLQGELNERALERSLRELVRRHESLRTCFPNVGGEPRQQIGSGEEWQLRFTDLRGMPDAERETAAWKLAAAEAARPFELERGPVFRAEVLTLAQADHVLLLTMHHIVSDGWSMGVLLGELNSLYGAYAIGEESPLEELQVQFADYAVWQREWLSAAVLDKQLSYWKRQLAGAPEVLELPTDRARPAMQSFAGASQSFSLSAEVSARLREVSRSEGVTLYMLLLAAFQTLLYRHTGQTDLVVGTGISNRNLAEVEGVIGFFVNTLVLRTDLSGDPSFSELLGRVREVCLGAYTHQDVPFEKLVEELRPERSLSHTPLFQVMFALQYASLEMLTLPDLTVSRLQLERLTTHFDLMLGLQDSEQGLSGTFEYSTELFEEESIRRMVEHYQRLLGAIVADPQVRIEEIPLLSAAELQLQLVTWNETAAEYPRERSIQSLFETQVARIPEAVALVCDGLQVTYGELNERANRLAHLLREQGIGTETGVGICLARSVGMVVSILAVLKAGGVYVALDGEYPVDRLSFMCADARLQVVLTSREQCARLPSEGITKLCVEELSEELLQQPSGNPSVAVTGEHLAYIVYTSGSTGTPKGISIPHRAVSRLVCNTNYISLSPSDTLAQLSNSSFDALTFEIWGALLHGARLVILSREVALSVAELSSALREHEVSAMFLTTALFNEVARQQPDGFAGVRAVLFGGETVDVGSVREVLQHGGPGRLLHVYGPTEATTFSSWEEVVEVPERARSVPIGKPLGNTELFVLDARMRPVPPGVRGELYIGGEGLARGYWNRAELTAESFVPHAYSKRAGARLYRTGDVVRQLSDGRVEFVGRADRQMKLRGFRIELGEIEAVLRQHAGVKDAVLAVQEDERRGKLIIAYVVREDHITGSSDDLRGYLRERLPEYMVPVAFVELGELPLTANGKVDRKALPAAEREERAGEYVGPRTPVEEVLAGIWCEVLGVERVGIHENFFELGGHSLLATQVVSRVRDAFKIELPVRAVFELQTIAGLSHRVDAAANADHDASLSQIRPAPRNQDLPLSFAQQRLWFLDQLNPDSAAYNIPAVVRLTGALHVEALERTLSEIIRRHESLRTTFQIVDGQPVQVINDAGVVSLGVIDVSSLNEQARAAESELLILQHTQQPFDLSRETMLRPGLLRLAADEHILLMTMHHIVSDGWSMGVLIREMATLYAAYLEGAESPLGELPIQYADFAKWQREWLQGETLERQLAYWRKQLSDAPPTINLPTDRPRPAVQTFESETITFALPEALSTALKSLSQREGVTLFMTLMAAYNTLLYRYTGQEDILVGTGIANRNRSEIEGLIGFFVNMLVMRTDLKDNPSFLELLGRVRETAFGAYAHQDLPFEKLVEELQPERDLSHTPFFQVTFVLQNASAEELTLPGLEVSLLDFKTGAAKFDLILLMTDAAKGLSGTLEYNTNLFDAGTIQRLLGHFRTLLESVVANPQRAVSELSLLGEPEQRRLLAEWNNTSADYPSKTCIHHLFEQQVANCPEKLVVVHEDEQITYGELNRRANQLAHHLRSLGVGPESHVGICLERSAEMVVALLGVMKAGGAYVPLDPQYPRARLEYMLEDSHAEVLLTQGRLLATIQEHHARVICIDLESETIARQSTGNPSSGASPDNLVYIIYTSGSTGKPKGVLVQHRGLCNLTEAQLKIFAIQPNSRMLQFASLSFDASIFEIVMAWRSGATLYLTSGDTALPGAPLAKLLRARAVTHVTLPPSVLAVMPEERIPSLRTIIVAGEACPVELVQRWGVDCRFFNAYGPTEATVWATVAECQPDGQHPTIGQPIINAQVYLLDTHLQPVPVGVPGELHIGGVGLARGYLNCPDLTAERFIPNPFSIEAGSRLYKTGDLARFLPGGEIDYLGRIDHQVKVRGFRIELGEIESVLGQYQGVREVVVLAQGNTPSDSRLVAYLVPDGNAVLNINELRQYLSERLPEYMVPTSFAMLDALPLTANGKVDRRSLSRLRGFNQELESEFVAPRNETEQIIAAIWQDALQIETLGIDDNFFDLGGHSLLMVGVHNKLSEHFKKDVPIADLFKHPTVRRLTECFNEEPKQTSSQSIRDRAKKQKESAMRKRLMKKPGHAKEAGAS